MAQRNRDVLIVGCGASGLAAAIAAARRGASVVVLEADQKPARKLLRTGNGRCNLSNAAIEPDARQGLLEARYNDGGFVAPLVVRTGCRRLRSWFSEMGLATYEDSEGRIYPVTNKARSVVDVLMGEAHRLGVRDELESRVEALVRTKAGLWAARCSDGRIFRARSVVMATGSAIGLARTLDIPVAAPCPVLGPVQTAGAFTKLVSGVRMRCVLRAFDQARNLLFEAPGEVLFRDKGVSGIVVFDASRFVHPGDTLEFDLVPFMSQTGLASELDRRCARIAAMVPVAASEDAPAATVLDALDGLFLREVARALLSQLGIEPDAAPTSLDANAFAAQAKGLSLVVESLPKREDAQITRGGIERGAIDSQTMLVCGLERIYACGEVIDVDAACGGYNLHWAWVSGQAAGANAAAAALDTRDCPHPAQDRPADHASRGHRA